MPAPQSIEATRFQGDHVATYYVEKSCTSSYQEVRFTDHQGEEFVANHFHLYVNGGWEVQITFDDRNLPDASKIVHGVFEAAEVVNLNGKRASNIYVKRAGGTDSTIRILAWR